MSGHLSGSERDALLDRELDPAAELAALEHLLACRACRDSHGPLLEVGALARLPRPASKGRRWPVVVGAAAAAALALAIAFRPRGGDTVVPPATAVVVVHSFIVTTTREANGIVARDIRRIGPGGAFERDRERIRPAGEGHVLMMALRRRGTHGEPLR